MNTSQWLARYAGTCLACEEKIHVGDPIRWADTMATTIVHDECDRTTPRWPTRTRSEP